MGKFERRLRKSVKDETPDFEEWYVKNEERLKESGVPVDNGRAAAIKRRRLLPLLCALGTVIVLLAVLLPVLLTRPKQSEDFRFYFSSELETRAITAEDKEDLKQRVSFLTRFDELSGDVTYHREKGTTVFARLTGEIEITDYFMCEAHILFDEHYQYFAQSEYLNLSNRVEGKSVTVTYGQTEKSDIGLFNYCVTVEYADATVYMNVQCFDGNITELIEQCIMAK